MRVEEEVPCSELKHKASQGPDVRRTRVFEADDVKLVEMEAGK